MVAPTIDNPFYLIPLDDLYAVGIVSLGDYLPISEINYPVADAIPLIFEEDYISHAQVFISIEISHQHRISTIQGWNHTIADSLDHEELRI